VIGKMRRKNLAPQIGTSKGYLYIHIPRGLTGGKQKRIWGFGFDTAENQLEAELALSVIQRDIDYNEFDTTLQKYIPAAKTESSTNTDIGSIPKLMFLEERKEFLYKNQRELANYVGERLRLKKTGFPAYNMRHRYAVRGHELGFHIDDMARWMGHTVNEHTKTYQKYLGEETHFIAYESGIRKAIELKKIKNGCPSYSELEVQLEMAKAKIAHLETQLRLMKIVSAQET